MQSFEKNPQKDDSITGGQEVLIFLAGLNFWEGLFDNINTAFIRNLFRFRLAAFSRIIMTIIVPAPLSREKAKILSTKQRQLSELAERNGSAIEFVHIRGRTLFSMLRVANHISRRSAPFCRRFIWAHNYFNCFLGVLIKKRLPATWLHYDILGLAPEEELLYSESPLVTRMARFAVLKLLGQINLARADSISAVSRRFRAYIKDHNRVRGSKIQVIPCCFDPSEFFLNADLRRAYRKKYGIKDHQKLFLYSGMLQKWQMPDLLFEFFRTMGDLEEESSFRFMIATFDVECAARYARRYRLPDLIIDTVSGKDLNGVYNAADIGVATRTDDWVSRVSSPVKIPEYLITGNSLILLESIGDFGSDLKGRKFALVKSGPKDLLSISRAEIEALEKPDGRDRAQIAVRYGTYQYLPIIKNILAGKIR